MYNYVKSKVMKFLNIFKDKNDFNEKTIVGFMSFAVMIIFAFTDLISSLFFDGVVVNEYIYNSFLMLALGSFGISEVSKTVVAYRTPPATEEEEEEEEYYEEEEPVSKGRKVRRKVNKEYEKH